MNLMTNNPTMSSREIAGLTGSRHSDVMACIARLIKISVIGGYAAEPYTHPQNGQRYSEYNVGKRDSFVIVAQLSPKFTAALVDRWQELEEANAIRVPQTMPEALRLAADLAEQVEAQKAQLAIAAPTVAFVNSYVEADGLMGFRKVAKLLGAKEPAFSTFLIDQQIMYRLEGVLTPYAQHLYAGRFAVKTGVSDNGHAFTAAKFTPKGVEWVAGKWAAYLLENTTEDDRK